VVDEGPHSGALFWRHACSGVMPVLMFRRNATITTPRDSLGGSRPCR
jgi:hypothetical protein